MENAPNTPNANPTLNEVWGGFNGDTGIEGGKKPVDISTTPAQPAQPVAPPVQPAAPAAPAAPAQPAAPAPAQHRQQNQQGGQQPQRPQEQIPQEQPQGQQDPKPGEKPAEDPAEEPVDEPGEEQPAEGDDDPMSFWNDVNSLRGRELDVDLSTFEDPTSPEAYMAVENAVRQEAMQNYDAFVEQTDPRAYAYFLHRRNGGSDAEFFAQASDQLPEYETFKGNVDLQKQVLTSALKGRGVSDKVIALTIQEAEKDGSLFTDADREYQARQSEDTATLNALKKQQADREAAYTAQVNDIESSIDNVVFKGQTKKIVIPEAKRNPFATFLKGKLIHDDASGAFIIGQRVDKENLTDVIEALYFQFSGGDISKMVNAGVKTAVARRLGGNVRKAAAAAQGTQNKDNTKPDFVALTDLF